MAIVTSPHSHQSELLVSFTTLCIYLKTVSLINYGLDSLLNGNKRKEFHEEHLNIFCAVPYPHLNKNLFFDGLMVITKMHTYYGPYCLKAMLTRAGIVSMCVQDTRKISW